MFVFAIYNQANTLTDHLIYYINLYISYKYVISMLSIYHFYILSQSFIINTMRRTTLKKVSTNHYSTNKDTKSFIPSRLPNKPTKKFSKRPCAFCNRLFLNPSTH